MAIKDKNTTAVAIATGLSVLQVAIALESQGKETPDFSEETKFNLAKTRLVNNLIKKKGE